jgi:hypothetical protein
MLSPPAAACCPDYKLGDEDMMTEEGKWLKINLTEAQVRDRVEDQIKEACFTLAMAQRFPPSARLLSRTQPPSPRREILRELYLSPVMARLACEAMAQYLPMATEEPPAEDTRTLIATGAP